MFISCIQGAPASTNSVTHFCAPPSDGPSSPEPSEYDSVRHMLFGPLPVVRSTIRLLHRLNYAEPNDWSQSISTGRPNEVMAILTKRIRL
ncbi:MAG: hypothetical protein WA783_19215 [Phormidesmis sp.]